MEIGRIFFKKDFQRSIDLIIDAFNIGDNNYHYGGYINGEDFYNETFNKSK
jgi:hypothetical protein